MRACWCPSTPALRIEQRYFTEILQTNEAAAMIRSLFVSLQELNKGARRPAGVPETKFTKIGVIGAGFMGAGIAYVTAKAGIPVVLIDRDMESAEKGKAHSDGLISDAVKKGRAKPEEKEKLLSLITPSADYADLDGCRPRHRGGVRGFGGQEGRDREGRGRAESRRRSSPPTPRPSRSPSLAKNSARPKNFIGIHFFSPVDKMMLVEIILGKKTGDKALAVAIDYVRAIKKTPIVVNDTRGFYVNRCVLRYMSEAYKMLIEGVPAPMIENAAKAAGMPVGPLALTDETAIDLAQKIMKQTIRDLGEKAVDPEQMELINTLVDKHGRFGRKNGKGFYDYPAEAGQEEAVAGPEGPLSAAARRRRSTIEELKQRFLVTIALEAARVMEEGIVTDPREADVGSILAFGFAPYHRRRAVLHRRHGREGIRRDRQGAAEEIRRRVQGAEAAARHGREGRDLLPALRPLRERSERSRRRKRPRAAHVCLGSPCTNGRDGEEPRRLCAGRARAGCRSAACRPTSISTCISTMPAT